MSLPLQKVKVLDLSRHGPGGFCTLLLADLGADILKIEQPGQGDLLRAVPPFIEGDSVFFLSWSRNKRSMTLDLKHPKGREIFYKLVRQSDCLLESFRPGVPGKLGIDYDTLKLISPRLVYCSLSGFGQEGPYRDLPGHDANYLGICGMLGIMGEAGGPPRLPAVPIADLGGGSMMAAIGILAGYIWAQETGQGLYFDIALMDGVFSWLHGQIEDYLSTKEEPVRGKTLFAGKYPMLGVYETKDGKYISTSCLETKFWQNLCVALGLDEYVGSEFDEDKKEEMRMKIAQKFKTKTRDEWIADLFGKDICIAPVNTFAEACSDPQLVHRNMLCEVAHPTLGKIPQVGNPIKVSGVADDDYIRMPPPSLGQHTDSVLESLGYTGEQIAELHSEAVV